MITLNYTISEQEYKDFYYFMGWRSPARRSYRIRFFVKTFAAYLVFLLLLFYMKNFAIDLPAIIITLVVMTGLYFYSAFRVKRHYHNFGKKVFDESGNSPVEVSIGETGIFAKGQDGEANYKWSAFVKKFEENNCYYLLMSSQLGIIIPQRVFRLQKEQEAFEKMLSEYLPLQADLPMITK